MTRSRRSLTTGSTSSWTAATDRDTTPQSKRRPAPIRHNPAPTELVEQHAGVGQPRPIAPPYRSSFRPDRTVYRTGGESAACYRIAGEMRATRTALPDAHQRRGGVSGPSPSRPRILSVLAFFASADSGRRHARSPCRPVGTRRVHGAGAGGLRNASMLRVGAARWLAGGLVWSFGRVGQRAPRVWCRRS